MAVKAGTFTGNSGGASTQSITGVGFEPKLLLVFCNLIGSFNTASEGTALSIGSALGGLSSDEQANRWQYIWNNTAFFAPEAGNCGTVSAVIIQMGGREGAVSSFDADGFSILWSGALGSAVYEYTYIAIGGDGVEVAFGTQSWRTTTGSQSITAPGFEPDFVLFSTGGGGATPANSFHTTGWVDGSLRQGVTAMRAKGDWSTPSDVKTYQRSTLALALLDPADGSVVGEGVVTALDSTGFTVNWSTAWSTAGTYEWIAVKGVHAHAGVIQQPTSSGTHDITGLDVTPAAALFLSQGQPTNASAVDAMRFSLGVSDGDAIQHAYWLGENDAIAAFANRRAVRALRDDAALLGADPSGTNTATYGAKGTVAFAFDSMTVTWTADATAREFLYLALGEPVSQTPGGDYIFRINSITIDPLEEGFRLWMPASGIWTLAFSVDHELPTDLYQIDDVVEFLENGEPLFKGPITSAQMAALGGESAIDPVIGRYVASSQDIFASFRYITETIPAGTLKEALEVIAPYFVTHGITLDPTQVDGPTLPDLTFTKVRGDEVLNRLAELTGYIWAFGPDDYLKMYAPGTFSAPGNLLASGDVHQVGDVTVEPTRDDTYANRVILTVTGAGSVLYSETITFDGSPTLDYQAKYPAPTDANTRWPNEILLNGGPSQGPIGFNDGSSAWEWITAANTRARLVLDGSGLVPNNGDTFVITYEIAFPFDVIVEDLGSPALPIREIVVTMPEGMTLDEAEDYAESLLSRRSTDLNVVKFDSHTVGWRPGQTLTITLPKRDIDASFLVQEVVMAPQTGGPHKDDVGDEHRMRYQITAIEGTVNQGNWRDTPKSWIGGGTTQAGALDRQGSGASGASVSLTYLTEDDETDDLPQSRMLVAGDNVSFDVSTPGQLIIDVDAGSGSPGSPSGSPSVGGGDWTLIEEQTPSGVGTITFSSLGSYAHLVLMYSARGTQSATATDLLIQFNGDSGANYDTQLTQASTSATFATELLGQTSATVATVSAANATSNYAGSGDVRFMDYRGTSFHKTAVNNGGFQTGTSSAGFVTRQHSIGWRSTSAITSITLTLASGDFVAGSKFTLYGLN